MGDDGSDIITPEEMAAWRQKERRKLRRAVHLWWVLYGRHRQDGYAQGVATPGSPHGDGQTID